MHKEDADRIQIQQRIYCMVRKATHVLGGQRYIPDIQTTTFSYSIKEDTFKSGLIRYCMILFSGDNRIVQYIAHSVGAALSVQRTTHHSILHQNQNQITQ